MLSSVYVALSQLTRLPDGSLAWKAYSTGPDAETLHDANTNKENPQYNALSVYEEVNGGNKQGGSFKKIPNDQLKIGEQELGTRTWLKGQAVKMVGNMVAVPFGAGGHMMHVPTWFTTVLVTHPFGTQMYVLAITSGL